MKMLRNISRKLENFKFSLKKRQISILYLCIIVHFRDTWNKRMKESSVCFRHGEEKKKITIFINAFI